MSRSSAIAKSALFFALRRGKGGGGTDSGTGVDPYTWAVQNGVYSGNQNSFVNAWKKSLELQTFPEYLQSIGYTGDINQANTYILQLINGEIKSGGDDFYTTMEKLGFTNQTDINTVMINLLNGTLTMKEFYKNLQSLGYTEDFKAMQDRLYELFTSIFATEDFVNTQINNVNTRIDNEVNTLNTSIDKIDKNLQDHIKEDNDAHDKLQIEINNVNTNLTNTINTLEQKHDKDIKDVNDRITTEINNVNDNIQTVDDKLEQHIKDADDKFTIINNELSDHEERISALENGEVGEATTPWTYFVKLTNTPNTPENKAKFDQNYIDMGNGDTVYAYAHNLYPSISKNDFNVIMLDLVMGKFYNQSIYQQLQDYGYTGTESQAAEWLLKLVNGELGDGVDPYNYMKASFPDYDATREEFNHQYGALMMLYLNGNANGGNASGDGMWDDKWSGYIPNTPSGNSKTLYEMYKDIGYPGTEEELYAQLVIIAQTLFTDGGNSKDDKLPGVNEGWSNYIPEPDDERYKTLYELYQRAGLDKNSMTEAEFNTKAIDYMQNSTLPYIADGGSSENNDIIGPNEGFINADIEPGNYNIYHDIEGGNAAGNGPGGQIFINSDPSQGVTDDFFQTLKKAGYRYDIDTLSEQILELTNVDDYSVNIDAGGASTPNNDNVYDGPIPEARNAIIDYLVSQGWEATEENVENFDSRFIAFANGSIQGTLDSNMGANE